MFIDTSKSMKPLPLTHNPLNALAAPRLDAGEDTGFITPGGLYKSNNLLFDFGRAYFNEQSPIVV